MVAKFSIHVFVPEIENDGAKTRHLSEKVPEIFVLILNIIAKRKDKRENLLQNSLYVETRNLRCPLW
jgi:hypothetical protein